MTWRILILLMALVGLGPLALELRHGRFEALHPKNAFILYYLVQLGASGWITLSTGRASAIGLDPALHFPFYEKALLYALLGLAAFQAAYYLQPPWRLRIPPLLRAPWREGRASLLVGLAFLGGGLSFLGLLAANGGLRAFLDQREAWRAGGMAGQGILLFPATTLLAVASLVALCQAFRRGRGIPAALGLLVLAEVPAFLLGFRGLILIPLVQALVLWHVAWRPIGVRALGTAALLLGLGFTAYGILREMPPGTSLGADSAARLLYYKPELAYTVVSRSKGTEVLAAEIRSLERTGRYDLGWRALVETLTIPVPRSLWPAKGTPASVRFTTEFFGEALHVEGDGREDYGGVSPTIAGELYWHFGLGGILAGMALLGALLKVIHRTAMANLHHDGVRLAYPVLFTTAFLSAEALQGNLNGLFLTGLLLGAVLLWLTLPWGRPSPRVAP